VANVTNVGVRAPRVLMVQATPGMRGPARTLLAFAAYLAPRASITLAVPEGFLSDAVRAEAPNAEILSLPLHGSRARSWAAGARRLLAATGGDPGFSLIHANGLSALNLAAPMARARGATVLVHFHASEMTLRSRLYLRTWRSVGVRMAFLPVSGFSRRLLERTPVRDLIRGTLPNPIDVDAYAVRRRAPRQPFRVGFMGSKSPNKGLHRLIEVADILREEEVEWHVYGIDPERNRTPYVEWCLAEVARRGLDDRVTWWGKVEDPREAYAEMDALMVPSERESFSRVTLEAMACGLPVVATRVGGIAEVVQEGVSGWLFHPRRPEEAAGYIRRLTEDQALWEALSAGAVRTVTHFDISTIGARLERFYEEALKDGTGRRPGGARPGAEWRVGAS